MTLHQQLEKITAIEVELSFLKKNLLGELQKDEAMTKLCSDVCRAFGTEYQAFASKSKKADLVSARAIFYYLARLLGFTIEQIGQFAGRHHSTIVYHSSEEGFVLRYQNFPEHRHMFDEILTKRNLKIEPKA